MGDITTTEVLQATRIDGDRFNLLCEDAESMFWSHVVRMVPEARAGDLDPGASHAFAVACRQAISAWLIANMKPTPTTGAATVTVELRTPRKGERGWWVKDDSSAHAALREVLHNCPEEPPGFEVDADNSEPYDEEGMRFVTVIAGDAIHIDRTLTIDELMATQGYRPDRRGIGAQGGQYNGYQKGDVVELTHDCDLGACGDLAEITDLVDGDVRLTFLSTKHRPALTDKREIYIGAHFAHMRKVVKP